jgi:hypothetical protein
MWSPLKLLRGEGEDGGGGGDGGCMRLLITAHDITEVFVHLSCLIWASVLLKPAFSAAACCNPSVAAVDPPCALVPARMRDGCVMHASSRVSR